LLECARELAVTQLAAANLAHDEHRQLGDVFDRA